MNLWGLPRDGQWQTLERIRVQKWRHQHQLHRLELVLRATDSTEYTQAEQQAYQGQQAYQRGCLPSMFIRKRPSLPEYAPGQTVRGYLLVHPATRITITGTIIIMIVMGGYAETDGTRVPAGTPRYTDHNHRYHNNNNSNGGYTGTDGSRVPALLVHPATRITITGTISLIIIIIIVMGVYQTDGTQGTCWYTTLHQSLKVTGPTAPELKKLTSLNLCYLGLYHRWAGALG